jgi:hypothetical protein
MTGAIRSGALAFLASACLAAGASAQQQQQQPARNQPSTPRPAQPAPAKPAAPAAPAAGAPSAATPLPGAPWAAPVLPPTATPPKPAVPAAARELELKPDPKNLIDCKDAPKAAVVQVPEPLSRWATIYCTKQGHILTSNENFYSAIPRTRGKVRGVLSAAQIGGGRKGEIGHGAYFTKIDYAPVPPADAQKLMGGIDPAVLQLVRDKPLFRLALTVDTGQSYQGVVVDPTKDPFWVIPIVDGKLARTGFYVATVDFVRTRRMQ